MHPLALKGSTLWQGMHYVAAIFCTARPSIVRGAESRCDKMHPTEDQSGGAKYRRDTFFRVTPALFGASVLFTQFKQVRLLIYHLVV